MWPSVLLLQSGGPLVRCTLWATVILFQSGGSLVKHTLRRDILWPSVLLLQSVDLLSDIPPMIILQFKLTFSQASSQADLWSDVPSTENSCGLVCYYISQVDLWTDITPAETSCGHVCYYFS